MNNDRSITYYDDSLIEIGVHIQTSKNEYATLIPSQTLQVIQNVLEHGANCGKRGFEQGTLDVGECLDHAIQHIYDSLEGKTDEPHLDHALTRLFMAVAIDRGHVDRNDHMDMPVKSIPQNKNPEYIIVETGCSAPDYGKGAVIVTMAITAAMSLAIGIVGACWFIR